MKELFSITKPPIKHLDLVKYSGASGDFNPIHTVSHIAHQKGHPDVLVHGMFLMGWASQALEEWYSNCRLIRFSVRFIAPTYPGETLTIKETYFESNGGKLEIINSIGDIKLTGSFDFEESIDRRD